MSGNIRTGIDIVDIDRIENILELKDERFLNKIFTDNEIEYIINKGKKANTIAGIFAAKEAVAKLLGSGIGKFSWKDIELYHKKSGKPYIKINKKIREKLDILKTDNIDVSISHEKKYAVSIAVGVGKVKDRRELRCGDGDNIKIPIDIKEILKSREADTHKGSYGRVAIIAGSSGMTGAPYLSCQSALRAGSGLVYSLVPNSIEDIMSIKLTEVIVKSVEDNEKGYFTRDSLVEILDYIETMDVIAVGPGMGVDKDRIYILEEIIKNCKKPIILDADAINCLSIQHNILYNRNKEIILTPHPGELGRFLDKSISEIQENRIYYAKYAADKYNIIVVLKGSETVVASPEAEDIYVNTTGNPGMATAGSGDVLTGMISSFVGQGIKPLDASILSVFTHGLAGDLAKMDKGEHGMIASDIMERIPESISKILL